MIGEIVQVALEPPTGEVSTRLVDALMGAMGRPAQSFEAETGPVWFSASDVHNLCPRLYQMAKRDGLVMREAVDPDLHFTFAVGTGYHRAFQDEMMPMLGDVFQGAWEPPDGVWPTNPPLPMATMGPHTERGWYARPEGFWWWNFREPKGRVKHCRLVGKWDGVLAWPDAPHEVFELKSIRADLLPTVDARVGGKPWAKHLLQCQAYLWMSGLDWARLVYVAKGNDTLRVSVAEHLVPRDEAVIKQLEEDLVACCAAVDGPADAPLVAPLMACRIKSDSRARRCPLRNECFEARKVMK